MAHAAPGIFFFLDTVASGLLQYSHLLSSPPFIKQSTTSSSLPSFHRIMTAAGTTTDATTPQTLYPNVNALQQCIEGRQSPEERSTTEYTMASSSRST